MKEQQVRSEVAGYDQFFDGLPAAIYTCDAQGRITSYNEEAAQLWGRKPVLGKEQWCGSWKIFRLDGTRVELDTCPMAIAVKEGRSVHGEEVVIERPDMQRRHVLPYPKPLFDSSGAISGAINMIVDITERRGRTIYYRIVKTGIVC